MKTSFIVPGQPIPADDAVVYAVSANKLYNERAFTVVEIFTKEDAP